MRIRVFTYRCAREILRDPINLCFGLGFPLVLLLLLSALQRNIPVPLFEIETLAPGICIFGLSFMTLFTATLLAKDRESAFLQRLYTTPMKGTDFIFGYLLSLLPLALGQTAICFLCAIFLGLHPSVNILYAAFGILPMAIFHISLGLLCGSLLGVKQVGGLCGALLTNFSGWLSGIWFDLKLVGGVFQGIANILPFVHGVEMEKALLQGDLQGAAGHILPVMIYSVLTLGAAVLAFFLQMKKR